MLENLFNNLKRPVIVAMVAMRMMEMSINQIVHMVAMRNSGVATIRAMNMLRRVFVGGKTRSAFAGIGRINSNRMFVHMVAVRMMQVAVVKIIHMAFMVHRRVSAIGTVDVRMIRMSDAGILAHNF